MSAVVISFLCITLLKELDAILIRSTPSYVSNWTPMRANSPTAKVTLRHDLQEDPAYVKVEARTENGFIFPAFGSAQQDDDTGAMYGGVVFVYNSTHVDLFVPVWNNGPTSGQRAAIYTGDPLSWAGPYSIPRIYMSVIVRAMVWRSRDLPAPSWNGSLQATEGDCINATLEHSLMKYPDMLVVKIKTEKGSYQGQGLASTGDSLTRAAQVGGLLYGSNESHVRLWTLCDITESYSGLSLLSVSDGWGQRGMLLRGFHGSITVTAWDLHGRSQNQVFSRFNLNDVESSSYGIDSVHLPSLDVVNVQLHILDGANKDFRFDGVGSVMNEAPLYGGLVYGYNDSMVAIWVPTSFKRSNGKAAVFMLGQVWGWAFKAQATNNVDIVVKATDILVPICLLDFDLSTTIINITSKYERYNASVFAVGDTLSLQCLPGYRSVEVNSTTTCESHSGGSWNPEPIICEAITCPSPVVPNTQVIHLNDSVGGSVTLSCVVGFDHVGGNLERTCLDTGTWSGVSPICTGCFCQCPIHKSDGNINETAWLLQRIQELKNQLTISRNSTTKAMRRKHCAYDPRASAKGVGATFGAGLLISIATFLIISDLPILMLHLKQAKNNFI